MIDKVAPHVRSRMMSAVKGKNTKPELHVRRAVHAAGFRFRIHRKELPGRPDLVLPRFRIAVFVHGCFWHGHSCSRGKLPKSNATFWKTKIEGNMGRDRKNATALKSLEWTPVVIWSCDIRRGVADLLRMLRADRSRNAPKRVRKIPRKKGG
jgi:DNA mismatch endonuclease, patch repair protein